jgi:hypothetical protein
MRVAGGRVRSFPQFVQQVTVKDRALRLGKLEGRSREREQDEPALTEFHRWSKSGDGAGVAGQLFLGGDRADLVLDHERLIPRTRAEHEVHVVPLALDERFLPIRADRVETKRVPHGSGLGGLMEASQ